MGGLKHPERGIPVVLEKSSYYICTDLAQQRKLGVALNRRGNMVSSLGIAQ